MELGELELARAPLGSQVVDEGEGRVEKEGVWDGVGYMRAKKRKQREQFAGLDQKQTSDIFNGVTIYVNGWTQPNADELKRLVHAHGGHYEYNLYGDSRVTHTIATNLPHAKIRNLKDTCLVCTPDWIVDSIESGKRLPVDNYLLYSRQPTDQKTLEFKATCKKVNDAAPSGTDHGDNATPSSDVQPTTEQAIPTKQSVTNSLENLIPKAKPSTSNRPYDAKSGSAFVSDYYAYSRLHYLSTWSTELKQFTTNTLPQVTQRRPKLPTESSLRGCQQRLIVHIDLDCFFVSVSLRDRPALKGRAVAVCHAKLPKEKHQEYCKPQQQEDSSSLRQHNQPQSSGNDTDRNMSSIPDYLLKSMSDIASCSYEARSTGLHNGMCVGEALKLCPQLQLLPYEFEKYHKVSQQFYRILMSYSATIETVSCDEAYIELTDYVRSVEEAERVVREMREEIKSTTGCTVSAGMAGSILLARMATRVAKPNGQHFLSLDDVHEFMSDQRVQDLPGVGYVTAHKLREAGVETCGQLRKLPLSQLKSDFGSKTGQMLYNYCRGVDRRHLKLVSERKSLSVDLNFGIRFQSPSDAENLLKNLSDELEKRAVEAEVAGGTLTLKLMIRKPDAPMETRKYLGHGRCNNVSRSCTLLQPISDSAEMCRIAVRLLNQLCPQPEDIRGVGLQLTRLVSSSQKSSASSRGNLRNMLAAKLPSKPQLL